MRRGTTLNADCPSCPFATANGEPSKPVTAEFPSDGDPAWVIVAELPMRTEVQLGVPLVGQGGQLVNKVLGKIGCQRSTLAVTYAILCSSKEDAVPSDYERAASACSGRLRTELAMWPGKPILTLGSAAARAVIPRAVLDAIDPPDVPKSKKRDQKKRQKAIEKALSKHTLKVTKAEDAAEKQLAKLAKKRLNELRKIRYDQIREEVRRTRRKFSRAQINHRIDEEDLSGLTRRAELDAKLIVDAALAVKLAQLEYERANPKPPKPKKKKPPKISDILGTCLEIDVDGSGIRPVIPSLHPMSIVQGGGATIGGTHTPDLAIVNLIWDASKVDSLSKGKDIRLNLNIQTEIADPERTWQLLRDVTFEAIEDGEVAIDLETYVEDPDRHHALMAHIAQIKSIGFATSKRAVSILWELLPSWAQSYLQLMLGHPGITKVFHNGLYDRTVFMANGFTLGGPWEDTLLAHHAAFPGSPHRLQFVASQFFAIKPWKSEFRNAEETPEGLTKYNAIDTGATLALRAPLTIMVKHTETEKIYALDRKMSEIATKMHLAGVPVSRETNTELLRTFSANIIEGREGVEAMANDPTLLDNIHHKLSLQQATKERKSDPADFGARHALRYAEIKLLEAKNRWKWKINSSKHVTALLQAYDVPLSEKTKGGQISTKKDVLEALAHMPVVRDLLLYRENAKLLSTFIWNMFDRYDSGGTLQSYGLVGDDGRAHPIWLIHKITGRWAGIEPLISNVPKDKFKRQPDGSFKQLRPNLRRQIRAPRGRKLVGFDYSQLEARIIALISGDPFLCGVFAAGLDIHRECARVIFAGFDTMHPKDQKKARDETKPLEYGAFYGGSIETLWKQMLKEGRNVKLADIAIAIHKLMSKMAGVVAWQRNTIAAASQPPFEVRDFLCKRRRTFPLGQVEATEAMNFGVQSAGAAIMNTGMAIADEGLSNYKQAFAIMQIHDAAVFECWEDDAEALAVDVTRWFEQEYERDGRLIPFPIEVKIGDTWADV